MRNIAALSGVCPVICCVAAALASVSAVGQAGLQAPAPESSPPVLSAEAQEKLNRLQANVRAAHASHDGRKEAAARILLGDFHLLISEEKKASDDYNQALMLARDGKDPALEAAALNGLASCSRSESANDDALRIYQEALSVATVANDAKGQASALLGTGILNENTGQPQKARSLYSQALALAHQARDSDLEAQVLNRVGGIDDDMGNGAAALDDYQQALNIWRAAGNGEGQAMALNNIGVYYSEISNAPKALENYSKSLPLYRQAGDRAHAAGILNDLGVLYRTTGDEQKALAEFQEALPIERALGNRRGEAPVLMNIGNAYFDLGRSREALDAFNKALAIHTSLNNPAGEAGALYNMSGVWLQMGELEKALDALQKALALFTIAENARGEADTLNAIGIVFDDLGQPQQAEQYYSRALVKYEELQDPDGQATALNNIAGLYNAPSQAMHAIELQTRALQLERTAQNRNGEALTLNNMGLAYEDLGEKQKALDSYQQSLAIRHDIGDRDGEASVLDSLGSFYSSSEDKEKARDYYSQALPLARAVGDAARQAKIFHDLMLNERNTHPALAIFYGKQAVNLLQRMRGAMQGLDQSLQKSFVLTKDDFYHDLASLLIAQGRLPEAQQVLDLLKDQEYADYVRGATQDTLQALALAPAEQQAQADYERSTAHIVAIGEEWAQLRRNDARTPEQEKTFQQLNTQLDAANKALNDYYARLYVAFGGDSTANDKLENITGDVSLLRQAIARSPGAVALYTLAGNDRYRVIVITGSTQVAREYAISRTALNQKVAAFRQVLRDPLRDARPLAAELYNILIGPVAGDLDQAQATTLIWSLDGVLRYVPIAALYDGAHYMVEKYNTVTITPVSIPHLAERPDVSSLSAAAMGISRKYEPDLPALPAVAGELDGVVHDAQSKTARGALPGSILLDGAFTEKAMENLLGKQFSVVHIASHFVFKPGDDSQSYLLLAGQDLESPAGYHLTVAGFRDDQLLALDETELLTLSACETGISGVASNGREVDGLGTTAQRKGAKAVISSLWEVDDASTGALMADFYKRWADGRGNVMKVEALRQAQLDLLEGKLTPQSDASGRGLTAMEGANGNAPPPASYARPFYWAPFVLMGNWR